MIRCAAAIVCALALATAASAASLPTWARDVIAAGAGNAAGQAVVLIDSVDVTIGADGRMRTVRRYAVSIRDREGRDAAAVREVYVPGSGSIQALRGWIVKGGVVRELDARAITDAAIVNNDVYNEVRVRRLSAAGEVAAGETFVAELESEERLLFSQFEWQMQHEWPARLVRRTLALPQGWSARSVVFNTTAMEPRRDGGLLTWERRDAAALPDEPSMPPMSDVAGRLAVSVFAPAGGRAPGQFESWQGVAQWLHGLSDASSAASASIAAKARELTNGATTDFDRAAAIARFAQRVQYISIQTGIGRGGGYQPRPAALVLERNYGDCKDKASLMRAMLTAIGIKSYLVTLYSGDRNYVRSEWPSPQQFNHAIIAIAVAAPADRAASAVAHPDFGSLVIFDPTDPYTTFGELPIHEQGSLALVVHPKSTALVRLPLLSADRHAVERIFTGAITPNGDLTASINERYTGAAASRARAMRGDLDDATYRDVLAERVAAAIPRGRVARIAAPSPDEAVAFDIEARGFAQDAGGLILIAMPFDTTTVMQLPSGERHTQVVLEPRVIDETVKLQLPGGLVVDEVQKPVRLDSPFGRYSLEFVTSGASLQAKRRLEIPLQRIEPSQLPAARAFFDSVRRADAGVVVLSRK